MNRDIKFRAWRQDEDDPRMINWETILSRRDFSAYLKAPYTLMQYTGLKDQNGKEIYEGDLVRVTYDLYEDAFVGQVAFYRTGQFLAMDDPTKKYPETKAIFMDWDNIVTVIGNIYENKELLEKK